MLSVGDKQPTLLSLHREILPHYARVSVGVCARFAYFPMAHGEHRIDVRCRRRADGLFGGSVPPRAVSEQFSAQVACGGHVAVSVGTGNRVRDVF